jgi:hypothetical protein
MNASGVMHMLDALSVILAQHTPLTSSMSLPWHENMQESIELHCECYPALPTIVQTVPLHEASEPVQLTNI